MGSIWAFKVDNERSDHYNEEIVRLPFNIDRSVISSGNTIYKNKDGIPLKIFFEAKSQTSSIKFQKFKVNIIIQNDDKTSTQEYNYTFDQEFKSETLTLNVNATYILRTYNLSTSESVDLPPIIGPMKYKPDWTKTSLREISSIENTTQSIREFARKR
jgi:hypothetical protein